MKPNEKFVKFLNEIKTSESEIFIEGVERAFKVCFEEAAPGAFDIDEDTPTGGGNFMSESLVDVELAEKEVAVDSDKIAAEEENKKIEDAEIALSNEKVAAAEENLDTQKQNLAQQTSGI